MVHNYGLKISHSGQKSHKCLYWLLMGPGTFVWFGWWALVTFVLAFIATCRGPVLKNIKVILILHDCFFYHFCSDIEKFQVTWSIDLISISTSVYLSTIYNVWGAHIKMKLLKKAKVQNTFVSPSSIIPIKFQKF